jgi:hypothetical protein
MRFSLFCLLIPLFLSASQAEPISGFGAEGGLSLTYQNWDYKSNVDFGAIDFMNNWDNHFNAGVFLQFFDYKYFNLDADITYNQKGGLEKNAFEETSIDNNYNIISVTGTLDMWDRLDYVSFAPRAKFKYPMGKFDPFFSIGPSFDFLINKTSFMVDADIFKKYEVSALYGIGVGYNIDQHFNCFFEFLHQPGISFIYSASTVEVKNDVLKFNVGLLYQL